MDKSPSNNPFSQQQISNNKIIQLQDQQFQSPVVPNQFNDQVVSNPVAIYIPDQDHRLYLDPVSKQQSQFEEEKAKFQRDLQDIKAFGINTYEETKIKAKEKYDVLKQANPILQKVEDKGKQIFNHANVIADQIKLEYDKLEEKYKEFMKQQKERLNIWVRTKIQIIIMDLIVKSKDDIKEAIKDPYMFEWVQQIVDDLIEDNWQQIEKEILYRLRMIIDEPIIHQEVDPKRCCLIAYLQYLPYKYLYERIPYNKSVWYQFRRFWFWFFILFEIFPFYGIQSFFYLLVFFMIDKKDEWQLVRFIIVYKQFQFVFSGIIGGFIGYIQYFLCQSYGRKDYLEEFKKCTLEGPGVNVNLYADIIGIVLQICLTWFAYFLIPMSRSKGKNIEFKYNKEKLYDQNRKEEDEKQCCCCLLDMSKGGRLYKFMLYDLIVFIIIAGAFFGFIFGLDKKSEWQIRQILFMTKTLYCLLNFPFTIFSLPILPQVITEARKTGYDQYGVCVPKIVRYTNKEWDEIENQFDQSRSRIIAQSNDDEEKEILQSIDVGEIYK